jgi:hypothetical protein
VSLARRFGLGGEASLVGDELTRQRAAIVNRESALVVCDGALAASELPGQRPQLRCELGLLVESILERLEPLSVGLGLFRTARAVEPHRAEQAIRDRECARRGRLARVQR